MRKSEAVKQLEIALWEHSIKQHPQAAASLPKSYFPKPKREDGTANGLTQCIIDYIRLNGWQAERIAVTGRANEIKNSQGQTVGVKWTKSHMQVGTADISATIAGRSVKIEVKIGTDRQSEEQHRYQQQIEAAGGLYYIARNFTDFECWFKTIWHTS